MHGRSLLLLAAVVVAAAGTPSAKGPHSDEAAKKEPSVTATSEVPLIDEKTSAKPAADKVTTPASRKLSTKSSAAVKKIAPTRRPPIKPASYRRRFYLNHSASKSLDSEPKRQGDLSPVADSRSRLPGPRPRQFQPTIGDMVGVYSYPPRSPLLGPGADMGRRDPYLNAFPHFNPGFNPGQIPPPQFQEFHNRKPYPYFLEQWPYNPLPQHHLNNLYPAPQQDLASRLPEQNPNPESKFLFCNDRFSTLVNLPLQLTSLMQKVGIKAFSLKLKEWLEQIPVQTQPPIDGKLRGFKGCKHHGSLSGHQQGLHLGGKGAGPSQGGGRVEDDGRPLKVEATKMESGLDEDEAD